MKNKYKVFACFFENTYLLILKIAPEVASNLCSGFPSLSLVDFLQCIVMAASEQFISRSKAAFETTFRVTGGYSKAGTNFLKRITGRIFTDNK